MTIFWNWQARLSIRALLSDVLLMNEYKIQLESKEDLVFLKQEFANYIDSNLDSASTVSDNLRQQVSPDFGAIFWSCFSLTLLLVHWTSLCNSHRKRSN